MAAWMVRTPGVFTPSSCSRRIWRKWLIEADVLASGSLQLQLRHSAGLPEKAIQATSFHLYTLASGLSGYLNPWVVKMQMDFTRSGRAGK